MIETNGQVNRTNWRPLWKSISVVSVLLASSVVYADPARLWFSLSPNDPFYQDDTSAPTGPVNTATLRLNPNEQATVYVWGRPETSELHSGGLSASDYKRLVGISLNMAACGASVAVTSFEFEDAPSRFTRVIDSQPGNQIVVDSGKYVVGLSEYPLFPNQEGLLLEAANPYLGGFIGVAAFEANPIDPRGVGVVCEEGCVMSASGPTWLLGRMRVESHGVSGATNMHLQLGRGGLANEGEDRLESEVVFGADDTVYRVADQLHRESTLPGDTPDLRVIVEGGSTSLLGDYNGDGSIDAADYTVWRDRFDSAGAALPNDNGDGVIDRLDYCAWSGNYSPSGGAAQHQLGVPEPAGLWQLSVLAATVTGGWHRRGGHGVTAMQHDN